MPPAVKPSSSHTMTMSLPSQHLEVNPDVILQFDDGAVPGHSQLISLWSKVLREAVDTGYYGRAASGLEYDHPFKLPMVGTRSADWLKVVPFIYPGDGAEVTWDNLEALLVLGDKYDMPHLASRAAKFLNTHVAELNSNEEDDKYIWNWIYLLDRAAGANRSLCDSCISRVATYFKVTCTSENMKGLSRGAVERLASALAGTLTHLDSTRRFCPRCGRTDASRMRWRPGLGREYFCTICNSWYRCSS